MGVMWDRPIEAVHVDGRVVPVYVVEYENNDAQHPSPDDQGDWYTTHPDYGYGKAIWKPSGETWAGVNPDWHIRNVTPQPPTPEQRAMELVRDLAAREIGVVFDLIDRAKAICAEMEPVDVDLVAARQIIANEVGGKLASHIIAGEHDGWASVKSALAAIAKGRTLERGEG